MASSTGSSGRAALEQAVTAWLAADPDPQTRSELEALLQQRDWDELNRRFSSSLTFGTAGLRGALGAGPNRMNRVVVRQTTAALATVLGQSAASDQAASDQVSSGQAASDRLRIVIGHDARRNSEQFAQDAAEVAATFGCEVLLLAGLVPTPVLAYAVRQHQCQAGVMVTASHNPPQDNGYKVYWADGAQIVSPHDRVIEQARQQVGLPPADLGQLGHNDSPPAQPAGKITTLDGQSVIAVYAKDVAASLRELVGGVAAVSMEAVPAPTCVYTPLHGVGLATLTQVFGELGLPAPEVVAEQAEPDGSFPTVGFPNPEEPGALDLALELARQTQAEVVLANDPDADRLAVALRQPDVPGQPDAPVQPGTAPHPGYRVLSGDELGVLLADGLLSLLGDQAQDCLVGTTVVSSQLLAKIAAAHQVGFAETLTGFKWLARLGDNRLEKLLYCYEEALGYAVLPELVRDKDGISAAALFMLLLEHWRQAGTTPAQRLDDLAAQHGLHLSSQLSLRYEGAAAATAMAAIMGSLRTDPPRAIGSVDIAAYRDYAAPEKPGATPANVLAYYLADGTRIIVRPSGTEPKLKAYLEVIVDPGAESPDSSPADSRSQAERNLAEQKLAELSQGVRQLIEARQPPMSEPAS